MTQPKEKINVVEGNKLIAEFMEFKFESIFTDPKGSYTAYRDYLKEYSSPYIPKLDGNKVYMPNEFLFHSSWDWLMPVCTKLGMKFVSTDINKTYGDVIERIMEANNKLRGTV